MFKYLFIALVFIPIHFAASFVIGSLSWSDGTVDTKFFLLWEIFLFGTYLTIIIAGSVYVAKLLALSTAKVFLTVIGSFILMWVILGVWNNISIKYYRQQLQTDASAFTQLQQRVSANIQFSQPTYATLENTDKYGTDVSLLVSIPFVSNIDFSDTDIEKTYDVRVPTIYNPGRVLEGCSGLPLRILAIDNAGNKSHNHKAGSHLLLVEFKLSKFLDIDICNTDNIKKLTNDVIEIRLNEQMTNSEVISSFPIDVIKDTLVKTTP